MTMKLAAPSDNRNLLNLLPPTNGRLLEVVAHLDPQLGGMSTVVPRLSAELVDSHKFGVNLCVFHGSGEQETASTVNSVPISVWPSSRISWCVSHSLRAAFRSLLERSDAVHIHGLWETSVTVSARLARAAGKPYVISAHGMLEPWALANKALKKRMYSALLERTNLEGAACLHALTEAEAEDYRQFGCKRPIAVIPNGVDVPPLATAALLVERFPQLAGKSILLFLGRIHFKKGLDILIPAWAALASQFTNTTLVLAGPDSENSLASIQRLIDQHGIAGQVLCTGMLHAELKWSALAAATCFILPSYSEGLSVAVLEALSMGVPVIASEQCHIPEIERNRAGWIVKTDVISLQEALKAVLENSPSVNASIGDRGRSLSKAYRWQVVAGKMADLYQWILGGPQPTTFTIRGPRA